MPNTRKRSNPNTEDMTEGGRTGQDKKNEDKSSEGGSQTDNRGSGSRARGKSNRSN